MFFTIEKIISLLITKILKGREVYTMENDKTFENIDFDSKDSKDETKINRNN